MKLKNLFFLIALALTVVSCGNKKETTEKYLRHFIEKHLQETEQIYLKRNLAQWDALISNNTEAKKKFEEIESNLLERIVNPHGTGSDLEFYNTFSNYFFTDYEDFEYLKKIKESGYVVDTTLKRQLDLLYLEFLYAQIMLKQPEGFYDVEEEISEHYSQFKYVEGEDSLSIYKIFALLRESSNQDTLQLAWKGISEAAKFQQEKTIEMVKMRNSMAESFGYNNYYELYLSLFEQDKDVVNKYLVQLDEATKEIYADLKQKIDISLAKAYAIEIENIKPYHYQSISLLSLPNVINKKYKDCIKDTADFKGKAKEFLDGLGLSSDEIIDNSYINISDTNRHLFSFSLDVDDEGDSRVAVSARPNYRGVRNFWHNLGHSVYEKYIPVDLPQQFRSPNIGVHEMVATFFEGLLLDSALLYKLDLVEPKDKQWFGNLSSHYVIREVLFSRYIQVLVRFEQELYENPDQDLNKKWWDLMSKYMLMNPPHEDYSSRWGYANYVFSYDCYMQHYVIGMFGASQLKQYISKNHLPLEVGKGKGLHKQYGKHLQEFFVYGNRLYWEDLIEETTGEELTASYYKAKLERDYRQLAIEF